MYRSPEGFPTFPFHIGFPLCHDSFFGFLGSSAGDNVAVVPNTKS